MSEKGISLLLILCTAGAALPRLRSKNAYPSIQYGIWFSWTNHCCTFRGEGASAIHRSSTR